jgi:hypothetical protein
LCLIKILYAYGSFQLRETRLSSGYKRRDIYCTYFRTAHIYIFFITVTLFYWQLIYLANY